MLHHKVYIKREKSRFGAFRLVKDAALQVLKEENVMVPCSVNVLITDDEAIHKLNREYRGVDRPTDVLSFPMQELKAGHFCADPDEIDPESGTLPLGDIVISYDRAVEQAKEFGHSPARETAYLTVHSMLHLLGYDHMDEGPEKAQMRKREEEILGKMGLAR